MIRDTSLHDDHELLRMGKEFFNRTQYGKLIDFDEETVLKIFDYLRNDKNGILLVAEQEGKLIGMVGAILYPFYFNRDHFTGQELFWWVDEDYRNTGAGKALLESLEAEARQRGAKTFTMMSLDSMNPEKIGQMYEKQGYMKSEHTYIRCL